MRLAAAALCLVATAAGATTVDEFLARWQRIQSLGQMARLDPDLRTITEEVGAILAGYRDDVAQAAAAGKPRSCLPPAGTAQFKSDALIAYLNALAPAERKMELKDAIYAYLDKSYPCPAAGQAPPR